MAKSNLCLVLLAAVGFTVAQLVLAEQQQQNIEAIAPDVEVQPKSEQVQFRILREADAKKKKKVAGNKSKNGKSGKGKKKGKRVAGNKSKNGKSRKGKKKGKKVAGNKSKNGKPRKGKTKGNNKGKISVRKIKSKCKKSAERCKNGKKGRKGKKGVKGKKGKKRGEKTKRTKKPKKDEKKQKQGQKINAVQRDGHIDCTNGMSCIKISKDYRKYRTSLNQVRRIIRNCETIAKKENKTKDGIFNKSCNAICTKEMHPKLHEEICNCTLTATLLCAQPPECKNMTFYKDCETAISTYQDAYGVCLATAGNDIKFCECVMALKPVEDACLNLRTIDIAVRAARTLCTGAAVPGSFGFCRNLQIQAADECNCKESTTTTSASNMTTSGSGSGRKKILRENLVKKWIKN